ncbi:MAG: ABC transporter ATP-binding protein [Lachnospiraceae bacterium]
MIKVENFTLKYPNGKGVFDLNFTVNQGEVTGYLGPNGAGKTTTIRALMGFMKASGGRVTINGLDCYEQAAKIKKSLGYIPGEISFPDGITGEDYLNFLSNLRGKHDLTIQKQLIDRFELDLHGKVKKYSKGMKQKLGIVIAFMHNPKVYILDEPTSGLDPLMQNRFIELINEEKKKGKTILMSSHIFEEVERTCDEVQMIKDGRIITHTQVSALKSNQRQAFLVKTKQVDVLRSFGFPMQAEGSEGTLVFIREGELNSFIKKLATIELTGLELKTQGLEDLFMSFYQQENQKKGER